MAANYEITLNPQDGSEEFDVIELEDVVLGFNGMGWLIFVDQQQEIVAAFMPTQVKFAIRTSQPSSIIGIQDTGTLHGVN